MNGDTLAARIEASEGRRLKPYRDTTGHLTIGVGRNLDAVGLSNDECSYLLRNDILRVESGLDALISWWRQLDDARQMVVAEMAFNLGVSGLMAFVGMLSALKVGDYAKAADEMLDSRWARQVGDRAKKLADEMRSGQIIA